MKLSSGAKALLVFFVLAVSSVVTSYAIFGPENVFPALFGSISTAVILAAIAYAVFLTREDGEASGGSS